MMNTDENRQLQKPWPEPGEDFDFDNFIYDLTANLGGLSLVALVSSHGQVVKILHLGSKDNIGQAQVIMKLALDLALLKRPLRAEGEFFCDLLEYNGGLVFTSSIAPFGFVVVIGERVSFANQLLDICRDFFENCQSGSAIIVDESNNGNGPLQKGGADFGCSSQQGPISEQSESEGRSVAVAGFGEKKGEPKQGPKVSVISSSFTAKKTSQEAKALADSPTQKPDEVTDSVVRDFSSLREEAAKNIASLKESVADDSQINIKDIAKSQDEINRFQKERNDFFANPLIGSLGENEVD